MSPRWRWVMVVAVVLAALAASAWYRQRATHPPDIARPGGVPVPAPQAGKPAPAAAERPPRDRPERERVDRP